MDFNDVAGGISQPSGEGIADVYSALRLNDSWHRKMEEYATRALCMLATTNARVSEILITKIRK